MFVFVFIDNTVQRVSEEALQNLMNMRRVSTSSFNIFLPTIGG